MPDFPPSLQLSPNFTLGDCSTNTAVSRVAVQPQHSLQSSDIVCNLQALCVNCLESIASKWGRSTMILTSGFRRDTGGSSQHELGQAMDLQFTGISDAEYYNRAVYIKENFNYDQLILEYMAPHPWIHISWKKTGSNRRQVLTAPAQGVYNTGLQQVRA
jgi:hypothetical protein